MRVYIREENRGLPVSLKIFATYNSSVRRPELKVRLGTKLRTYTHSHIKGVLHDAMIDRSDEKVHRCE